MIQTSQISAQKYHQGFTFGVPTYVPLVLLLSLLSSELYPIGFKNLIRAFTAAKDTVFEPLFSQFWMHIPSYAVLEAAFILPISDEYSFLFCVS